MLFIGPEASINCRMVCMLISFKESEKKKKNYKLRLSLEYSLFFISSSFFKVNLNVAYRFHEFSFKCCFDNAYKHHHTGTLFTFTVFVPMPRPRSIYVASM